ncbi:MAG: O-antigen ligase family protein, partial [Mycobacteriales bacterium]
MDAPSMRFDESRPGPAGRIDWGAGWTWLLCFGLIAYLGLKGGGYDPLVHDQVGIAVWWVLLTGTMVGALPNRRPGTLALIAAGLLTAFVFWTALSLTWTESVERTSADLARVVAYLGVFVLALFSRDAKGPPRVVSAVAAGIVFVVGVGLLSRLHPAWFPAANQTAQFLSSDRERLSYPLHYWNGVAALIAIGMPLVLHLATRARSIWARALAAAALPALALTLYFTLSRGGIAAAAIALAVFLVFVPDRLSKVPVLVLAGLGGIALIVAGHDRVALQHGLVNASAEHQGFELLALTLLVCAAVGVLNAGISLAARRRERPAWTRVSRRRTQIATAACLLVALLVAGAVDAPGRTSEAWAEFKEKNSPGNGTGRLASAAGQDRYQLWSAAVKENASAPLIGTGSGTFEYWWDRTADVPEVVRDTHSLYLQTLGELGIVGLLVLVAFVLTVLVWGVIAILGARAPSRAPLAAALAGCTAFFLTAAVDWMWQLPVLSVAMLLLAATLVAAEKRPDGEEGAGMSPPLRLATAGLALAAIVAIAIPLASTSFVRRSEANARAGDLPAALKAARTAQNVQPDAASPRLQEALVLEAQRDFPAAAEAARAATEREPTNWRTWLVLS